MRVTQIHATRAGALLRGKGGVNAPAFDGYLAAVERTGAKAPQSVAWQDTEEAPGAAWVEHGVVWIDLDPNDENAMVHALDPSSARERAYELLVLADEAEALTARAQCDPIQRQKEGSTDA